MTSVDHVEAWRDLCFRCHVRGRIPVTFSVVSANDGCAMLTARMLIDDLTNFGSTAVIGTSQILPAGPPSPDVLRSMAAELYDHELREQFRVDDERPFDPHAPTVSR